MGYMLVVGGNMYKFVLLLSGIVCGKCGVIGNGVVFDFEVLFVEIGWMVEFGLLVMLDNLLIVENVMLVLLIYCVIDEV